MAQGMAKMDQVKKEDETFMKQLRKDESFLHGHKKATVNYRLSDHFNCKLGLGSREKGKVCGAGPTTPRFSSTLAVIGHAIHVTSCVFRSF